MYANYFLWYEISQMFEHNICIFFTGTPNISQRVLLVEFWTQPLNYAWLVRAIE
jgi:hypothetical protein